MARRPDSIGVDEVLINRDEMAGRVSQKPELNLERIQPSTPTESPTGSLIPAIFSRDTTIGSAFSADKDGSFNQDINGPSDFLEFVPEYNMPRFDSYALVTNQEEADTVTRALMREDKDTATIAANPFKSFGAQFLVQPFDPANWIPGTVIFNNAKRLSVSGKAAIQAASAGVASTVMQETIISDNQLSRTYEESVFNTLAAATFSAVVGGSVAKFGPQVKTMTAPIRQRAVDEMVDMYVGTAKKLTKDGNLSAEQIANMPDFVQFGMIQSSKNRMQSGVFDVPKKFANDTYQGDFHTVKNEAGHASKNVESEVKMDLSEANKVFSDYQNLFFEQAGVKRGWFAAGRANRAAKNDPTGQIFNWEKFDKDVGEVMFSRIDSENSAVNDAAKLLNEKIRDPYRDRAIAQNLLPNDVAVKNATDYFSVLWNQRLIKEDPVGFFKMNDEWMTLVNSSVKKIRNTPEFKTLQSEITALELKLKKTKTEGGKAQVAGSLAEVKSSEKLLNQLSELLSQVSGEPERSTVIEATTLLNKIASKTKDKAIKEKIKSLSREARKAAGKPTRITPADIRKISEDIKAHLENLKKAKAKGGKATAKELKNTIVEKQKELNAHSRNAASHLLKEDEIEGLFHHAGKSKGKLRTVQTRGQIESAIDQTTDRILGRVTSGPVGGVRAQLEGKAKPLIDRSYLIPQRIARKYQEQSASIVMGKYIHSMSPVTRMTELAKENGFNSIKEWYDGVNNALLKEFKEKAKGKEGKESAKLDKEMLKQKQNIKDTFEIMLGVYGDGPNIHDNSASQFYKHLLNWNYVRLLGFMTLSSIPDIGLHVFTHGPFATIYHGLRPVLKQSLGALQKFSKDDLNAMGYALNTVMGTRLKALSGHEGLTGSQSFFGKTLESAAQGFGNLTMMNQWNDMQQVIAGTMSINRSLKVIERIATGKRVDPKDVTRLAKLGVDKTHIDSIHEMWVASGSGKDGGTYFADWVNWKAKSALQIESLRAFKISVANEIDSVVIVPGKGDKPNFTHKPLGKLLAQFKSFQFAATNKILFAGIQRRDWDVLWGSMTMLSLGALSYITTQTIRGNDDIDMSFENLSKEAIDKSGLIGIASEVFNLANKAGLGFTEPTSRFQSRGIWGTILGPSGGLVEDFLTVVNRMRKASGEDPFTTKDLEKVLRLAPYQNLFYTYALSRQLINDEGPKHGFPKKQDDKFKDIFK